jgi:DNA replication initiation complex subunit (GINS family)
VRPTLDATVLVLVVEAVLEVVAQVGRGVFQSKRLERMARSEDSSKFGNSINKATKAMMRRRVEVTSSRVRQADVAKVAKQIRCNKVVEMGLEDTKRQVERSLVQDGESLFGDLLADQEDRRASLLDVRSRFSGIRGHTQEFQVVTAVLVD